MSKKLDQMSAIEIANYELSFHGTNKKAVSVREIGRLECEITLDDGNTFKASGLIAYEISRALSK
jgi:hypothetical protein